MSVDEQLSYDIISGTTAIVSAYVSKNSVHPDQIPALIHAVSKALSASEIGEIEPEELVPAVSIKKSITPDYIICLEDGKKFKSLKRHLSTHYDMSPDEYRARWNLPNDYPMVAPNYASERSKLALSMGLGRKTGREITYHGLTQVTHEPVLAPAE